MKVSTDDTMRNLGTQFGAMLKGGEVIELVGDVGAGKTTFVKGLARGLEIDDDIQSPSFTINRNYSARDGLALNHYDFYRLVEADVMALEIAESLSDSRNVTVVEWGDIISGVLPNEHIVIEIAYLPETGREVVMNIPETNKYLRDIIRVWQNEVEET